MLIFSPCLRQDCLPLTEKGSPSPLGGCPHPVAAESEGDVGEVPALVAQAGAPSAPAETPRARLSGTHPLANEPARGHRVTHRKAF